DLVNGRDSQEREVLTAAAIDQFDHRAVVVERCPAAEVGDCCEDVIHRQTLPCYNFQPIAVEHISAGVLGFGHTVGYHNEAIPRLHLTTVAFISCIGQ